MEIKTIVLKNQTITYELEHKAIKTLYLKVEKGQLKVRVPLMMSLSTIERYIYQYQDRLLKQIEEYIPFGIYQDQEYVNIYGKRYRICLRDIGERRCAIHDDCVYVYHRDIQKSIEMFLKSLLQDYIEERMIYYLTYAFDLDKPEVIIKKYKGRWGSCFYKMNKISFNFYLVHLDKRYIDYVIVHELTHFLQPNHSSLFYQEMKKRMPDYKERQKELKGIHL